MENSEAIICQLCREPIWNFLCIDCIGKNIQRWLPQNLSQCFTKFHQEIRSHFHTLLADNYEPCLDCSRISETPLCPYCYTREAYDWIANRNSDMAASFRKIFFFYPFEGIEHVSESAPIEQVEESLFMDGFCDNCAEFSEKMGQCEGSLLCENCKA